MAEERTISIPRSARYFLAGDPGDDVREAWFVFHGYGPLADEFLAGFAEVDDGVRLIVAPEGLSRFYVEGGHGPVGASWMTKVARGEEIDDYVRYVDAVYAQVLGDVAPPDVRVHALGFSQGAATLSAGRRWVSRAWIG